MDGGNYCSPDRADYKSDAEWLWHTNLPEYQRRVAAGEIKEYVASLITTKEITERALGVFVRNLKRGLRKA